MRLVSSSVQRSSALGSSAVEIYNGSNSMIPSNNGEVFISGGGGEDDDDDDTEMVHLRPKRPNLQWKDALFHGQTLPALNQIRKNRHFCDVTLQIGKHDFPAHRVVLAAASPYFMELFTSEDDQPCRKEFELDGGIVYELDGGFQKDALERLVEYTYTAKLDVPGDQVKPVYMAAVRLKMDRVAVECTRFMLSHLDLSSCLDLRSMPGIAPVFLTNGSKDNLPDDLKQDEEIDLVARVDDFIQTNFHLLEGSRELRALPRICLEILHFSKEEKELALTRPLCELALDWVRFQWFEDETLTVDNLSSRRHLLFMATDNTLQDCKEIEQGSTVDSDVIQDYKKENNLLKRNIKKRRQAAPPVTPAKPRELLYSRYINQDDHAKQADVNDGWKVIACNRLDDQSILAVVTLDRHLATFSMMQRVNEPPSGLGAGTGVSSNNNSVEKPAVRSSKSPKLSRPSSIEREMVYASVAVMGQAKCAVGAACIQGKLVVCGGYDRGECLNSFESYDLEENRWTNLPSMMAKRGRFDVTAVNDDVLYAVAGSNGQTEEKSVERFDARQGKWTPVANLPVSLSNIGVCNLDGRVYCIGGTYGSSGTKYCFCLNEQEGKWERIANMYTGRLQAAVAAHQGKIWVVGGCDAWNPLRTVEIYDPATNCWALGPSLSGPRRGCGLAVRKGQLMVGGGSDGTYSLCATEILDEAENVWKAGPTMTTCRNNVAFAVVKDKLWAVGGFTGKVFLNTVECLDSETDEWTSFVTVPESILEGSCWKTPQNNENGDSSSGDESSAATFPCEKRETNEQLDRKSEKTPEEEERSPSNLSNEASSVAGGSKRVLEEGTEV